MFGLGFTLINKVDFIKITILYCNNIAPKGLQIGNWSPTLISILLPWGQARAIKCFLFQP